MKLFAFSSALALGLASLASCTVLPADVTERSLHSTHHDSTKNSAHSASTGYNNMGYYVNWAIYGRDYVPSQLPVSKLTHVFYAFANIRANGTVYLSDPYSDIQKIFPTDSSTATGTNVYGCVKQLYLLKKANRNLKVLLSIGGYTYSPNFALPLSTAAGRETFATTAVTLLKDLGFDGLDIDYEYPANATAAADLTSLLWDIRKKLDGYTAKHGGNRMMISAAMSANPTNYKVLDFKGMIKYVDFFNLMAYDYAGSWSNVTGHQANLYRSASNPDTTPFNTDQAIQYFKSQGVPCASINLGMPLYGRAFDGTAGLGKTFTGVGGGSWENGVWDYKVLPQAGAVEKFDPAGATYSYDASKKILISYDNKAMTGAKIDYAVTNDLGGGWFWETSGDRNDTGSLIAASYDALKAAGAMDSSQNTLSYPASKYANMAAGMP